MSFRGESTRAWYASIAGVKREDWTIQMHSRARLGIRDIADADYIIRCTIRL